MSNRVQPCAWSNTDLVCGEVGLQPASMAAHCSEARVQEYLILVIILILIISRVVAVRASAHALEEALGLEERAPPARTEAAARRCECG